MCCKVNVDPNTTPMASRKDLCIGEDDEELDAMQIVFHYWQDAPAEDRIHIIVQFPGEAGESRQSLEYELRKTHILPVSRKRVGYAMDVPNDRNKRARKGMYIFLPHSQCLMMYFHQIGEISVLRFIVQSKLFPLT
jgi:hypothetical protein